MQKDDVIYRQAAIDEVVAWLKDRMSDGKNGKPLTERLKALPSAEPETAKRIVGCSRNGMTMWYQCNMCHEPVDEKDAFCRRCGRRFEDD